MILSIFMGYGTFKIAEDGIDIAAFGMNRGNEIYTDTEKAGEKSKAEKVEKKGDSTPKNQGPEILNSGKKGEKSTENSSINIVALGEIMMGGNVRQGLNGSYALAFKDISEYTKNADYTIASLTTNVSNTEELDNSKSKYIVDKGILNAFNALGVDGLNITSDHMLDFSTNMLRITQDILKSENIDIIGLRDNVTYVEKDGIRVAIIGINNVIIGNQYSYEEAGLNIYNLDRIKATISAARQNADCVIIMTHYGKENVHEVTDVMEWFVRELIEAGADLILGGHSLGIYPVKEHNGKLIVYSLGYLIHDTDIEEGKKAAIFDITIDSNGDVKQLTLKPTYILNKKEVKLYKDVGGQTFNTYFNNLRTGSDLETYSIKEDAGKLIISK